MNSAAVNTRGHVIRNALKTNFTSFIIECITLQGLREQLFSLHDASFMYLDNYTKFLVQAEHCTAIIDKINV